MANPTYKLEYIPTFMIDLFDPSEGKLKTYYIIHHSRILSILE